MIKSNSICVTTCWYFLMQRFYDRAHDSLRLVLVCQRSTACMTTFRLFECTFSFQEFAVHLFCTRLYLLSSKNGKSHLSYKVRPVFRNRWWITGYLLFSLKCSLHRNPKSSNNSAVPEEKTKVWFKMCSKNECK